MSKVKVVSRKEIWEFLKGFLEAGAAVEAEHCIAWLESGYTMFYEDEYTELSIGIKSLKDLVEFMIKYIRSALKRDMKAEDVLEEVFKAFGEEFIIAEDGEKVDDDNYEIIYKIALDSKESEEIFKRKAIERIAIEIEEQKGRRPKFLRNESVNICTIDIDNLYEIWKIIERKRIGHKELEKDIEDFSKLVIKLFGEGVILEGVGGEEVELDWDNVCEVIPPLLRKINKE